MIAGAPKKIWLVFANGERHLITREPLEGIAAWAKGSNATVVEYRFAEVVYAPQEKKKKEP